MKLDLQDPNSINPQFFTISFIAFLETNRYFLGSKLSGLIDKYSLIAAVEAKRKSVSTLIFLTPFLIPLLFPL